MSQNVTNYITQEQITNVTKRFLFPFGAGVGHNF